MTENDPISSSENFVLKIFIIKFQGQNDYTVVFFRIRFNPPITHFFFFFYPLEVVGRGSETQLQVGENYGTHICLF